MLPVYRANMVGLSEAVAARTGKLAGPPFRKHTTVKASTMQIVVAEDAQKAGRQAAQTGAAALRAALQSQGEATIVVATGASQFDMLAELVSLPDIDWARVTGFHLDEYLGLTADHPASFRRYLRERFVERVPLRAFHYVNGEQDGQQECARLNALIRPHQIAVAFIGIGENGHLAFNDPPADFATTAPYLVVELDEACRRQQAGEGWFPTLADVPQRAISMSVHQILTAGTIICTVPDQRKAAAVAAAVGGPVTPQVPASALQNHADTRLFLDRASASGLGRDQ